MATLHYPNKIPLLSAALSRDEKENFFVSWDTFILPGQTIVSSVWEIPEGFSSLAEYISHSITDAITSTVYTKCNGVYVQLDPDIRSGQYNLFNVVAFSGASSNKLRRGFSVKVIPKHA